MFTIISVVNPSILSSFSNLSDMQTKISEDHHFKALSLFWKEAERKPFCFRLPVS